MKLTRQHAWQLELSEKELQLLRKILKDDETTPEEDAFAFALCTKVEHAYARASEWKGVARDRPTD